MELATTNPDRFDRLQDTNDSEAPDKHVVLPVTAIRITINIYIGRGDRFGRGASLYRY